MKLLVFSCLLAFAAADLAQRAKPAIDESVTAFLEGAATAGSLSKALGIDDLEIKQLVDDVESELGRTIREALNDLFLKIKESVDQGKAVGQELLEKVKDLRQRITELGEEKGEKMKELLKIIREKAKEALRKIMEKLGLGKRNLDDSMDHMARLRFRELVERIKEKLQSNETIQKIREYLRKHVGQSEIVKKLKELIDDLKDSDIREIIGQLLDYGSGQPQKSVALKGEAWEKVKNFFKGLNLKIQDRSKKFGEWVKNMWGKGLEKLKEKYGTIKAIAMEFIAHQKDMSSEMAREALDFFRPYKDDLGSLWKQIVEASKEAIGRF